MTEQPNTEHKIDVKRGKEPPPKPPQPPRELIRPTDHSGRRTEHDVHDDDLL